MLLIDDLSHNNFFMESLTRLSEIFSFQNFFSWIFFFPLKHVPFSPLMADLLPSFGPNNGCPSHRPKLIEDPVIGCSSI